MEAGVEDHGGDCREFVLRPCFEANWPQTVRIFVAMSAVCGGIALTFAFLGFWPIVPFAGLELGALGAALYVSARRSLDREVIRVTEGEVRVEKGRGRLESVQRLPRAWTEVVLTPSRKGWQEARLVLRSGGTEVVLGEFLAMADRRSLACELVACIGPMSVAGPLKNAGSSVMVGGHQESRARIRDGDGFEPFGE